MSTAEVLSPTHDRWTEPLTLRVWHLTRFLYEGLVSNSFNEARLHPWTDSCQTLESFQLDINPPAVLRRYSDFYGNCLDHFDVIAPHPQLDVVAASTVRTHPDSRGHPPYNLSPGSLRSSPDEDFHQFLQSSHYVSLEAEIWRSAVDALPGGVTDLWRDALQISHHIYSTFTYTPSATNVSSLPVEVIRTRKGVCQDYAHVMLAMCRSHGIPARYVSGYFFNPHRAPDDIEASHAWVEVYLPGYGWAGIDPTHDRVPDTRYIKLAVGRDYGDIVPVSGKFTGKGRRAMTVEVQVVRIA